ncbi:MAG: anthranilate phosphoribosyltransferase [Pseudomonadota bacterium]
MSDLDAAFARVLDGETTPEETKAFLLSSVDRMRDPAAIAAGARAMRARMIRVNAPTGAIDVCGTGGDGAHTLNISTAVGFVVAGAGVPVAKHGNRAMSSKCGAADVLEALGVKLTGDVPTLERALREANIAFLFAQNHHPAMRHVAAARREIGTRTIFNLLGPLSNPAGVRSQLMGVFAPDMARPVAEALRDLNTERAWVVHGAGGLDELANDNGNIVMVLDDGVIREHAVAFVGAGAQADGEALKGGTAAENAAALRALLDGSSRNETYRQSVELNAAAALTIAGAAPDLGSAAVLAREALDEGLALAALEKLIAISQTAP